MTEEQKEAMKRLKMHKDFAGIDNGCCVVNAKDLEIVLTLIEKQKEQMDYLRRSCDRKEECLIAEQQENAELENELEQKDKRIEQYQNMLVTNDMLHVIECENKDRIIDLMAERAVLTEEEWKEIKEKNIYNVIQKDTHKLIKQYFENKAKEVKNGKYID